MSFRLTIEGLTRDERRRLLDVVRDAIRTDGLYVWDGGEYPLDGDESSEVFRRIDVSNIYLDMSVSACAARYDAKRQKLLAEIQAGNVSASMSGIEYYPEPFKELGNQDTIIKMNMTWNGEFSIDRPTWRAEYDNWVKGGKGE